jgi:hypothetical protein
VNGCTVEGFPPQDANAGTTEIYCIIQHQTGLMKFGVSDNPERRLRNLQTASGYELVLIFSVPVSRRRARDVERTIHRRLEKIPVVQRMMGEWFSVPTRQWACCVQEFAYRLMQPKIEDGEEAPAHYADFLLLVDGGE